MPASRSLLQACKAAGGTDTDKVVDALEGLKYDFYKGPQYYRKCDHQSVQSVLVIGVQEEADMANDDDVFNDRRQRAGSDECCAAAASSGFHA